MLYLSHIKVTNFTFTVETLTYWIVLGIELVKTMESVSVLEIETQTNKQESYTCTCMYSPTCDVHVHMYLQQLL